MTRHEPAQARLLDNPLDRQAARVGVADEADLAQALLLGRRFEDEVAVAEDAADERLVDRDVEDAREGHGRDALGQDAVHTEHAHVRDDEAVHAALEDPPPRVHDDRRAEEERDERHPRHLRGREGRQQHEEQPAAQLQHRHDHRGPVLAHLVDHHLALIGDEVLVDPRIEQGQPAARVPKKLTTAAPAPQTAPTAPWTAFAASSGLVTR
ncbi:hypothetical protein [Microbacterium sp. 4R-513]|uniref:hypothetical protein n=1 Tax=Microbacterium sp. 4R-513 TaxID=2567934 RepID=UPI0019D01DAE|nr:hypothetical protein [Microbacterium sp. 4R-513]